MLKGVFAKNERGYRPNAIKKRFMIATNLTSICCVYKEKIVQDVSYRITWRPYKLRKLQHATKTVKKSIKFQTNHSDITTYSHLLSFATYVYIRYFILVLILFFKMIFSLQLVFEHSWKI